jgi:RNA polymerase sigma-70 factor, ECF subfamily
VTGSHEAHDISVLFEAHAADLYRYAYRRCASEHDAEEVVAETFAVAWRRREDLPQGEPARLWLFGTARMVLHNTRRRLRRQQRLTERLRQRWTSDRGLNPGHRVVAQDRLQRALEALSANDREVLQLLAWEELSAAEIAVVLDISVPAVWKRLERARRRLTAQLEPERPEHPMNHRAAPSARTTAEDCR